jgi:hypothetical protein
MACRGVWWCWPGLWVVSGIKRAAMTAYVGSPYFFSNNQSRLTKIRLTLGSPGSPGRLFHLRFASTRYITTDT